MVYVFCALYAEAAGIIEKYDLKKQKADQSLKFDVFKDANDTLTLVLTGIGAINAAVAVSSACTFLGVCRDDRIVNVGTCAGNDAIGTVFIANKIINKMTGKSFYPDMLLKTDISECTLVTGSHAVSSAEDSKEIYDMEAAGIFEAAAFFVNQDCISFIKVVSDNGIKDRNSVDIIKRNIENILNVAMPAVTEYIDLLISADKEKNSKDLYLQSEEYKEYIAKLSEDLHCSVTMQNRLKQLIRYSCLTGVDYRDILKPYYLNGILPAKNKNDGKRVLDELERKLI